MALTYKGFVKRFLNRYNTIIRAKKYRNRHLILKTLYKKRKENNRPDIHDATEIGLTFDKLSKVSNLRKSDVIQQLYYLKNEKEILEEEISYTSYYFISQTGNASYCDNKYLNKGTKEFWESTYDVVKNLSTLILLIIAVITFTGNWSTNRKNQIEIESLKLELEKIKDSINAKQVKK